MYENIWGTIKECTSEESILCTVTDEDGNVVNIISQIMYRPDGSIFDKSVMATNQSGTLYPEHTSKIVMDAISREVKRLNAQAGEPN